MQMLKKLVLARVLGIAIAGAFPAVASAQSNQQLKPELDALKAHVKELDAMIEKVGVQAQAANAQAAQASAQAVKATGEAFTYGNTFFGSGLFGSTFDGVWHSADGAEVNCPDGANGVASPLTFDGTNWVVADPTRGSNRSVLSLGLNWALMPHVNLKGEVRYDRSTGNVFKATDGQYKRENHVVGVSSVINV